MSFNYFFIAMAKLGSFVKTVVPMDSISAITLTRAVSRFPSVESLQKLPTYNARAKLMYKKFYRLRNLIDEETDLRQVYCDVLKRKFTLESFNSRRKILLGVDSDIAKDSPDQWRRIVNTYIFVFNSTVRPDESPVPLVHEQDASKQPPERLEKSILLNLLKIDLNTPNHLKLDISNSFLRNISHVAEQMLLDLLKKKERQLFNLADPKHIAYRDHLLSVMRLNESVGLYF